MKKFDMLKKDLKKVRQNKKTEGDFDYLSPRDFFSLNEEEKNVYIERKEKYKNEVNEVKKYNEVLEIKEAVIKHNIKCALFEEIKPVLIELINKYQGKPFGEKTEKKFVNEFKEKTGCAMYFDKFMTYSDSIKVFPLNEKGCKSYIIDDIRIYFENSTDEKKDCKIFTENNRLKEVNNNVINCIFNKNEYIEDINKYIRDYKKAYKKAYEAQEKLNEMLSNYNNIKVEGLESLDRSRNIYPKY